MNAHVEASVISGYEELVQGLQLPDPNDRHVLAAAIHGRADVIVTYDLKDFPIPTLACYGIEAQHPDVFIAHLFDLDPRAVIESVQRQRSHLKNPPISAEAFLSKLEQLQLPLTVRHLREYLEIL
jgi:PIN domain